jgi:hypothetical protein
LSSGVPLSRGIAPPTPAWGGTVSPFDSTGDKQALVDIVYVFGRWVYDSLHSGWIELHPVHFLIKIGQATQGDLSGGNWPGDVGDKQQHYDEMFAVIGSSSAAVTQAEPQNQWDLHPLIDGRLG